MSILSSYKKPLWLCLRFESFGLNCLGFLSDDSQAVVISDQNTVWQCTKGAYEAGIKPGLSINHALMLHPKLKLIDREHEKELKKSRS